MTTPITPARQLGALRLPGRITRESMQEAIEWLKKKNAGKTREDLHNEHEAKIAAIQAKYEEDKRNEELIELGRS